ncbi:MAG: hypothetical protein NT090_22520 [Acidobacteria bacterium]|nr:hypothetical protein [Acidobacteriota bacterium]
MMVILKKQAAAAATREYTKPGNSGDRLRNLETPIRPAVLFQRLEKTLAFARDPK